MEKKKTRFLGIMFVMFVFAILWSPQKASAKTVNITMSVGETKYLFPSSDDSDYKSRTVVGGGWVNYTPGYYEILSSTSTTSSCRIKALKETSSPVILRLDYYYQRLIGSNIFQHTGYVDYKITIGGSSGGTPPTSVSIAASAVVDVGKTITLKPTLTPSTANTNCTWSSSNPSVATVNNGKVTGISDGSVGITVQTSNGLKATCSVKVQHTHVWASEEVEEAACTTPGSLKKTCSICRRTRTEEISPLGHSLVKTEAAAATQTKNGNIEYWTCSRCGKIFKDSAGSQEISLSQTITPSLTDSASENGGDGSTGGTAGGANSSGGSEGGTTGSVNGPGGSEGGTTGGANGSSGSEGGMTGGTKGSGGSEGEMTGSANDSSGSEGGTTGGANNSGGSASQGKVSVNKRYTVNGIVYKVLSNGRSRTVTVCGPAKNKRRLTSLKIGNTVKLKGKSFRIISISKGAFKGCTRLKTVQIGNSVTSLQTGCFSGCTRLKTVTLGTGMKTISGKAFYNCKNLKSITIRSRKIRSIGKQAIKNIAKKAVIRVPKNKEKAYRKMFTAKTGFSRTMKIRGVR